MNPISKACVQFFHFFGFYYFSRKKARIENSFKFPLSGRVMRNKNN